jgi:hypothetical protein
MRGGATEAQIPSPLMGEGRVGVAYEARLADGESTPPLPLPIKGRRAWGLRP